MHPGPQAVFRVVMIGWPLPVSASTDDPRRKLRENSRTGAWRRHRVGALLAVRLTPPGVIPFGDTVIHVIYLKGG